MGQDLHRDGRIREEVATSVASPLGSERQRARVLERAKRAATCAVVGGRSVRWSFGHDGIVLACRVVIASRNRENESVFGVIPREMSPSWSIVPDFHLMIPSPVRSDLGSKCLPPHPPRLNRLIFATENENPFCSDRLLGWVESLIATWLRIILHKMRFSVIFRVTIRRVLRYYL